MNLELVPRTLTPGRALLLGAALAITLPACKKAGAIPTSAEGRVVDFAEHMPADAEGAIFVGDLKAMRASLTTVKAELGTIVPQLEGMQKEITDNLGVDLLDAASYAQAGIADAGMGAVYVKDRLTFMVYVEDEAKFDAFFAEKAKKVVASDAAPAAETIEGAQIKVLGQGDRQIAWTYDGKLAILTFPMLAEAATSTSPKLAAALAKTDKKASLASTDSFKRYAKALPADQYAVSAYGNPKALLALPQVKQASDQAAQQDPSAKQSLEWLNKNAESLGLGLAQQNREVKLTSYFGPSADFAAKVKAIGSDVPKSPWGSFATKDTVVGLRTGFNGPLAVKTMVEVMDPEARKKFDEAIKEGSEAMGINLEQDVLNNLTGNLGVFFNGINLGKAMQASQNPAAAIGAANLVVGAQFKDKAKLNEVVTKLLDKAKAEAGDAVSASDFEGGKAIALPDGAGRVIVKDDLLLYAAPEATDEQLKAALSGKTEKLGGDLGTRFAADAPYNGLFVNFPAVVAMLGPMAAMSPQLAILQRIDAASITADSDAQGMTLNLRVMLKNAPAAPAAAPAK